METSDGTLLLYMINSSKVFICTQEEELKNTYKGRMDGKADGMGKDGEALIKDSFD